MKFKWILVALVSLILALLLPLSTFAAGLEPSSYWLEVLSNTTLYNSSFNLERITKPYKSGFINFYDFSNMTSSQFEDYLSYSNDDLEHENIFIDVSSGTVSYELYLAYIFWVPFGDVILSSDGYLTFSMCMANMTSHNIVHNNMVYNVPFGNEYFYGYGSQLYYDVLGYSSDGTVTNVTNDVYSYTSYSVVSDPFFVDEFGFPTESVSQININVKVDKLSSYEAFGLKISSRDWSSNDFRNINPYVTFGIYDDSNDIDVVNPVTNEDLLISIQEVGKQVANLEDKLTTPSDEEQNKIDELESNKNQIGNDLDSAGEQLKVEEPDYGSARNIFSQFFSMVDMKLGSSAMSCFFDEFMVTGMAALSSFIALVSFILFGKK